MIVFFYIDILKIHYYYTLCAKLYIHWIVIEYIVQIKAINRRRNSIICVGLLNSSCILWHMLALDMPNWYQMPKAVINFYNICYCTKKGNCILDASFGRLCYMFQDKVTLCQIKSLFPLIFYCNFQVSTAMQKLLP